MNIIIILFIFMDCGVEVFDRGRLNALLADEVVQWNVSNHTSDTSSLDDITLLLMVSI